MDIQELVLTAGRSAVVYVFVLVVVRILGKRTIGDFTAFDLIVAFIISEVVDEPIYGDVPMAQGLLAIAAVAVLHYANSYLGFRFPWFEKLTGGEPRQLVRNGKLDSRAMAAERISEAELWSLLREKEIEDIAAVKYATLEPSGQLTVIKTEPRQELEKGDLGRGRTAKTGSRKAK